MKKLTLLIVLTFIFHAYALSQSCLPEGITFTTQAEINNFQTNYPNCTEIEGNVKINGNDITNLNGLNVLTAIGGYLSIGNYYSNNPVLTSLTGLDNVTSIGGNLRIYVNVALTSLTGLDNVTYIGGNLVIWDNTALTSLTALNNVTSIGGNLQIGFNAALTSLTGLDNVTSIGGSLWIWGNAVLTSLTGFDNVTSIEGGLSVWNNAVLTSLTGLENATSIGGELWIEGNDTLTSFSGLDNIDAASIDNLYIYYNISLYTCEVESICNYLASPNGIISIHDNAPGCNSQAEVEAACGSGVPNINFECEFSIYPNPAEKELFISVRNGVIINEVNIYNRIAQKVLHENRITNTIDVSMLRQGMYIIELVTNKWKIREKLIIR